MSSKDLFQIISEAASALRPPKIVLPSECANKVLKLANPGGYRGPYRIEETPYMREPLDMLSSREKEGVIFVGPARTGKTQALLDAWLCHIILHTPADTLFVQMNFVKARDYVMTRLNRLIRNSPEIRIISSDPDKRSAGNTVYSKSFKTGATLKIGWPSAAQLSGSDYRFVAFTDYDRLKDDVDGEGPPFALGQKRTQTFLSAGKVMAESSPGRDLKDPKWRPRSDHDAPPTEGIVALYSRSDRRRWYWPCPNCGAMFQAWPDLRLFSDLPNVDTLRVLLLQEKANIEDLAREWAHIYCPHCRERIDEDQKFIMNQNGAWIADRDASLAGYWLGGVAAAFQSWNQLIVRYLVAIQELELTGNEGALKATVNLDQGGVYLPMSAKHAGALIDLAEQAESWTQGIIPSEADPFVLIACVDVQANRFVYQIHAVSKACEMWIIDRNEILTTKKGGAIDPTAYPEHWDEMLQKVMNLTYRFDDSMYSANLIACDSGGASGTTEQAYQAYKRHSELKRRFRLVKGASKSTGPLVKESRITKKGRDMIPLLLVNTDAAKDLIEGGLIRSSGPGAIHIPNWLPAHVMSEFTSEVKTSKGWRNVGKRRNEGLDLLVYARCMASWAGVDKITFWQKPPAWVSATKQENVQKSSVQRRQGGYL